ncbi:MAG: TonB-dependent receptor [Prevotella sp.]|nr:TonB-dependent receptor [Prevotella sp.]
MLKLKHLYITACLVPCAACAESNQFDETGTTPIQLDQVVITGTRTTKTLKDTPVQTRVIKRDDIENSDATNIQELLTQELPGVEYSFAMNQLTHLNFAGFGGQSVLFLVDGERLAGETMDDVDFSRLSMQNVERVEIIKGAASALYGSNATGGIINIITRQPKNGWKIDANGRTRIGKREENRYGLNFSLSSTKVSNTLSFNGTNTAGYDVRNGNAARAVTNYYVHRMYGDNVRSVSDRLTWQPVSNLRFTINGGYYFRERETATLTLPDHYRDLTFGARGTWDITKCDNVELSYNFDQFDKAQHSTISDLCVRYYSNVQHSVRALYNHTFSNNDMLTIGGDYMRDYMLNTKTAAGRYRQYSADVFAQYDWYINDRWEAVCAVRYDYFSDGNNHQVTPKLNVRYRLLDNLTLRGGYGMGFRAPTLKEKYYIFNMVGIWDIVGSNVVGYSLKPEQSHNFNLSAEYSRGGLYMTGAAYYTIVRNRITPGSPKMATDFPGDATVLGTDKWLPYTNVERYNAYGLDITVQKHWSCGLEARLSYAYIHEQLPKDANGEAINNQYQPARPHSLTARIEWDKQLHRNYGINIALSGRLLSAVDNIEFVDYQTRDADGRLLRTDVHYPAYTIWKLQAAQRIKNCCRVTLTIDNIFNYEPEYHYFNSPFTDGIAVMAGVTISLSGK